MIKSLFRLARGTYGVWSQLRRLTRLIEWNLTHGLTLHTTHFGSFQLTGSVPPSRKDVRSALDEKYETVPVNEEELAAQHAIEILRKRARGEQLDEDDPGKEWIPS